MDESSEDAVKREVFEETGVFYEIERLAIIHENFFDGDNGSRWHEVAFYYLMKSRGTQELNSKSYTMGVKENMKWIPIKDLDKYKAFPSFMKEYLRNEHKGIEHIVTREN